MKTTKVWDIIWGIVSREAFTQGIWYEKAKTQQLRRIDVSFVVCWTDGQEKGIQVAVLKVVVWMEISLPTLSGLPLICPETRHCCDRSERIPRLKAVLFPEVNANATQSQNNQWCSLKLQLQRASQFRSAHDADICDLQPFLPPSTVVEYEITPQWCDLNML